MFGAVGRLKSWRHRRARGRGARRRQSAELDAHGGMTTPFREQFVGEARTPLAGAVHGLARGAARRVCQPRRPAGLARRAPSCGVVDAPRSGRQSAPAGRTAGHGRARARGSRPRAGPLVVARGPGLDSGPASRLDALRHHAGSRFRRARSSRALVAAGAALALSAWPVARLRLVSPVPRGASTGGRTSVYRGLVAAQVAIGVALAVPAALLAQSLVSLRARDAGFVVTM